MQTTLLGLAIALILALLAALVGPSFRQLERPSRLLRSRGEPAGWPQRAGRRPDQGQRAADACGDARRYRDRPVRAGQPAARALAEHRARPRLIDARRDPRRRDAAGRPAIRHRPEQPRSRRLAGDGAAQRDRGDRAPQHRGRPRRPHRCRQQFAAGARQALVSRPGPLADRSVPRRGRVRQRRRDLRLQDDRRPAHRRRHQGQAQRRDRRTAARDRSRWHARRRPRRAAVRRRADAVAAGGLGQGERQGDRLRALEAGEQGQGRCAIGAAGADRVPVRARGARRQARRRGGNQVRRAAAAARRAVGAADRSRPADRHHRYAAAAAGRGDASVRRTVQRHDAALRSRSASR